MAKRSETFKEREKFQAYLEQDSAAFMSALMTRYSWSATEVVDRLLRFFNTAQLQADGYFVCKMVLSADEADIPPGCKVVERGVGDEDYECLGYYDDDCPRGFSTNTSPALWDLMDTIHAGLTPRDGFAAFDTVADSEGEANHG